jgi:hypothetical protein
MPDEKIEFTPSQLRQELNDRLESATGGESIYSHVIALQDELAPLEDTEEMKTTLQYLGWKVKSVNFKIEVIRETEEKPNKRKGVRCIKVRRKQK